MDKTKIIQSIGELLLNNKKVEGAELAKKEYSFHLLKTTKRSYTKVDACKIFLRDGFIDRYSGEKLLFPGIIKLMSDEFPTVFKYHRNWKMSETHVIYWELFPTIDHLIPVTRGGADSVNNWITTSMLRNSAKSNWTVQELNWTVHEEGKLDSWDGLVGVFLELTAKKNYSHDKSILEWKDALLKAKKELEIL